MKHAAIQVKYIVMNVVELATLRQQVGIIVVCVINVTYMERFLAQIVIDEN